MVDTMERTLNKLQFQPFLSVSLLVVLILDGCAPATPIPTSTPAGVRFEPAACMFGDVTGIDCGYLVVPEDRSQTDGPQIKLAVAIIRSSDPHPAPDPVVYLYGGPGGHILDSTTALASYFKSILPNRDLIVFDQRGVGYSQPALECPEVENQALLDAPKNLGPAEEQAHGFKAYQACHDRLVQAGIDLSAYSSAASAADVNDLRMALGVAKVNLYGWSYGARLALTVMRDFPAGVRSVVLDSVYPPQADLDTEAAGNAGRALDLLFASCAADTNCDAAYPDLKTVFYDAARQLDTNPISFDQVSQQTQKKVTQLINGDRMINLVIYLLHFDDMLPYIPKWIYEFHYGTAASDFMLTGYMYLFTFSNEISSQGMRLSVQCGEETSFSSAQAIRAANASVSPRLAEAVDQGWYFAMCPAWKVNPAAAVENQPVVSDIPTLLLTGADDPVTSPAWAESTAKNLSHSYYFEFPWASHWLIYRDSSAASCALGMLGAFLADPTSAPDSTCIKSLKVSFSPE